MLDLIKYAEKLSGKTDLPIDSKQNFILSYITFTFFPWVCLILILNSKNWRRPVILILIIHYFLRATGNFFRYTLELRNTSIPNTYWPYSTVNWYVSNAIPNLFWLTGEIIGDWYPLLRTKAVTNNSKNMKYVYATCIIYNLVKAFGIVCYFMDFPMDLRMVDENNEPVGDMSAFRVRWWATVAVMQIASFCYDLSVILSLKKSLFDKLKDYQKMSKGTFLDKFKQISELRIFISMITSMIFLPFVITFVIVLFNEYKTKKSGFLSSDQGIEQLRQVVLSVNFTFMYIDQILLRCFAEKNKTKNGLTNKKSNSSLHIKSKGSQSFTSTVNSGSPPPYDKFNTSIPTPSSANTFFSESFASKRTALNNSYNDSSYYLSTYEDQLPIINHSLANMKSLDYSYNNSYLPLYNDPSNQKISYSYYENLRKS